MNQKMFYKKSLYITGIITVGIWSLLLWDYFHGGVPSHHILHQKDLPAISNWWSGLVLPLLTLFVTYRIQKRLTRNDQELNHSKIPNDIIYGFLIALTFGVLLSLFFTLGYSNLTNYMMLGLILSTLFVPIYRSECLLGFVIGMTYTVGAVLPTGVGLILALIGFVLFRYVRGGAIFIFRKIKSI